MLSLYEPGLDEEPGEDWCEDLQTIEDERFIILLDLLFAHADVFTMTVSDAASRTWPLLETKLRPYQINSIQTQSWFYRRSWHGSTFTVNVYRSADEAKQLLLDTFQDILLKSVKPGICPREVMPTLEDLCFFKNGIMFFGTLSHEYYCDVWPPSEEFERILHTLGHWKEFPYKAAEQPLKLPTA